MSDQKIKTAAGKVPLNLIPLRACKGASRVFQHGGVKYVLGNFLTAEDTDVANRYVGAFFRHIADTQGLDGLFDVSAMGKLDDESGLPEIDHALCGLIMLRAILTKRGILPEDPGMSKLVAAVGTDREPRDVSAPSLEPDDPAAIARANRSRRPDGPGDPGPLGPRFVVVAASETGDRPAEFGPFGWCTAWAGHYNRGSRHGHALREDELFSPQAYSRDSHYDTHAIVDTRPEEGGYNR